MSSLAEEKRVGIDRTEMSEVEETPSTREVKFESSILVAFLQIINVGLTASNGAISASPR